MTRPAGDSLRTRPAAEPVELAVLRGWLRAAKGRRTFDSLARRSSTLGLTVCACTLRRTLDGRLPTLRTTTAFARGAGADEARAERLWEAAAAAVRRPPAKPRAPYVPGRITTQAGLARALRRLQVAAGSPSLRALAAAPVAAGRLSRSALHLALTGQRLPSEQLLLAFAAACGAGEETTTALLAARRRVLAGPRPPAVYPCDIVERADERRQQDEAARPWLAVGFELDPYDQQLRDADEAEHRRMTAWIDSLTDDEFERLQAQSTAGSGRDLRAELAAYASRTATGGEPGR
ncbi:hypothetical protein OOK44_35325 [Streptomyces cellulosae]|uniref:Helix-turn-helix domain-containing protein n=1 Tax=Streptomyces althioticus TaxID=83380 RepID=A0ABZ1YGB1_9ACTN|nr:hypothetical protein [Streptomyces cellulosae]WTB93276.1 hypothetical protein OIE99_34075 [Streptomyces cellulosae]WTC60668.1 hypothetical protein OH715_35830 [Streptomyces cellulosae]